MTDPTVRFRRDVRISYALSCGCSGGKSGPVRGLDADTLPGGAVVCDRCQEYAVVVRVSVYLADTGTRALEGLLRAGGVDDPATAAQVAADQGTGP